MEGLHLCLLLGEFELEVLAQLWTGARCQCEHREQDEEGRGTDVEALVPAFLVPEVLVLYPEALGEVGWGTEGAVARAARWGGRSRGRRVVRVVGRCRDLGRKALAAELRVRVGVRCEVRVSVLCWGPLGHGEGR